MAMVWEEKEAPHVVFDRTSMKKRFLAHYVRKDAFGKVIGEVKQLGGIVEWTAEGMSVSVEGSVVLGKVRTAHSLGAAMFEVDSHLEGKDWAVFGGVILAPVFVDAP
jgi:hypothetical protein